MLQTIAIMMPLTLKLERQVACKGTWIPRLKDLCTWVHAALQCRCEKADICIRMVDQQESANLNQSYRHKAGATNVLSFCYQQQPLHGDLAICAAVLEHEANMLNCPLMEYWAHIVIHGALHLLGYDHQIDADAKRMEALESQLLKTLGYADPYQ